MLFWWLEKNGQLSTTDKVDKLYAMISDDIATPGTDYESITNRELALNTKGLVPKKVWVTQKTAGLRKYRSVEL